MLENAYDKPGMENQPGTSAVLIANPTSGSYLPNAQHIANIVTHLKAHGWNAELKLTEHYGDAARIAHEAVAQKMDIVVTIGGDGTIHEVIQELAGSNTALGVLPCGTINVWAREVGIPLDIIQASEILLNGQIRQIDLGQINDQYFLLMVGIGVDGEVTQAIEKRPAKRLGVIGYLLVAAWLGIHYPDFQAILTINNRAIKINALQVIAGNTQLYGGALKYTWRARCDDGLIDICVIRKRRSVMERAQVVLDFLLRRQQRSQWIRYETGSEIKLYTRKKIAIQVDGEPLGYTTTGSQPTVLRVAPKALKVIVPRTLPGDLFTIEP
jgi:YegS/Rv2252/BmrU family lipid kinase